MDSRGLPGNDRSRSVLAEFRLFVNSRSGKSNSDFLPAFGQSAFLSDSISCLELWRASCEQQVLLPRNKKFLWYVKNQYKYTFNWDEGLFWSCGGKGSVSVSLREAFGPVPREVLFLLSPKTQESRLACWKILLSFVCLMSNNARVKTILILAANPKNTAPLRLDEEIREIDEGLRRANKRELYKLEQKWAVRSRDFYRAILDYQPHIVHFCGHGAGEDGIVLEDDTGKMALVQTNALASMFKLFAKKGVECVILNACYSEVQAEAISQYVNYVVGMNRAVGDRAAVAFAVAFYDAIAAEYAVEEAYELGRSQMMSFRENEIPVLKTKKLPNSAIDDIAINFEEVIPPNPYQGLAAFGEEDADFFFGQ